MQISLILTSAKALQVSKSILWNNVFALDDLFVNLQFRFVKGTSNVINIDVTK